MPESRVATRTSVAFLFSFLDGRGFESLRAIAGRAAEPLIPEG